MTTRLPAMDDKARNPHPEVRAPVVDLDLDAQIARAEAAVIARDERIRRRAGYVVLEVGNAEAEVEFVRVEYDLDRTMSGIRASELPDDFAEYLARGGVST